MLGGILGLGLAIVGEDAVCPTEDEVTCKMDAAEDETNPTQSVVGDSTGLVACELRVEKGKHHYQIILSDTRQNIPILTSFYYIKFQTCFFQSHLPKWISHVAFRELETHFRAKILLQFQ